MPKAPAPQLKAVRTLSIERLMSNLNRSNKLLLLSGQLLVSLLFSCSSAPPAPSPWFNENLKVNDEVFPPGVEFIIIHDYSNTSVETDYLLVTNTSPTPLFFAAVPPPGKFIDELEETCPSGNLCLKVVSGSAWQWEKQNFDPPWVYGWEPVSEINPSEPLTLYILGRTLSNAKYSVLWFEMRNEYSTSERPKNVSIPPPQTVELPYIYGTKEKVISLTISYTLNESYSKNDPIPLAACIGGILLLIIGFSVINAMLFNRLIAYLGKRNMFRNPRRPNLDE